MPLWKITDNGPSSENSILVGAKEKIARFNSIGLHYNLVADAVYKKRETLESMFNQEYLPYIVAALISFEMERMMGPDRASRYDIKAGGFATQLSQKLEKIQPLLLHLTSSNISNIDIQKERHKIAEAYEVLAKEGEDGLNRREGQFHVGATKILHFLYPNVFLIIDSNAAKAFGLPPHQISFRNTTQPGYTADKYIDCMKCAQKDILDYGVDQFCALEPETPLARIYDKLTFITGSDLSLRDRTL
jgi:hypothetical protein